MLKKGSSTVFIYKNKPPTTYHIYEKFQNAVDFRFGLHNDELTIRDDITYFHGNALKEVVLNKRGIVYDQYVEVECDVYLYIHVKNGMVIMLDTYPHMSGNVDIISKHLNLMVEMTKVLDVDIEVNGITILYLILMYKGGLLDQVKYNKEDYSFYTSVFHRGNVDISDLHWFNTKTMAGFNIYSFENFVKLTEKTKNLDFQPIIDDRAKWTDDWFPRDFAKLQHHLYYKRYVESIRLHKFLLVLTEKEHGKKDSFVYLLLDNTVEKYMKYAPKRKLVIDYFQAMPGSGGSGSASIEYLYRNYTLTYGHRFCVDVLLNPDDYNIRWPAGSFWEKMDNSGYCTLTKNAKRQIRSTMKNVFTNELPSLFEDYGITYTALFTLKKTFETELEGIVKKVDAIIHPPKIKEENDDNIHFNFGGGGGNEGTIREPNQFIMEETNGRGYHDSERMTEMKYIGNKDIKEIESKMNKMQVQPQKKGNKYQPIKNIKSKIKDL